MSKKVLIVEDEEFYASLIRETVERLGYNVVGVVSTGEEAVQKAGENGVDLVLMDIVLKGDMDGVAAAKQIHECLNIPVIYLTGLTGDEITERAKITEPFGYILKPFQERELHVAMEMAFYKHEMERKLKEVSDEREKHFMDLEKMNRLMVGRELRMEELKKENERLKKRVEELEGE